MASFFITKNPNHIGGDNIHNLQSIDLEEEMRKIGKNFVYPNRLIFE